MSRKTDIKIIALFGLIVGTIFIAKTGTAQALTSSWNTDDGNWGNVANWDVSVVPNSSSADAVFPHFSPNSTININGTFGVRTISFPNNVNDSYTFTNGTINLYNSVTVAGNQSIITNTNFVLQNDVTFNTSGGNSRLRIFGPNAISGSHGITVTGNGIVFSSGATTSYTGTTTIQHGTLNATDNDNLSPNSAFVLADDASVILMACGGNQTIGSLSGGAASEVWLCGDTVTLGGNNSDTTYAGNIYDGNGGNPGGGITKEGAGTFTLSGTNDFSGTATVNAGILNVNGTLTTGSTLINSNGTLKGNGTLQGVTINGTVAPGNSIGTISGSTFEFANGSTLQNEINPNGTTDLVSAANSVTIDSGSTLKIIPQPGTYTSGTTYTIISAPSITGTFTNVTGSVDGLNYQVKYYPTHVDIVLSAANGSTTVTVNPPSTGYGQSQSTTTGLVVLAVGSALITAGGTLLRKQD